MFSLMRPGASGSWVGVRLQEAKCMIMGRAVQLGGLGKKCKVEMGESVGVWLEDSVLATNKEERGAGRKGLASAS